MLDFDTIHAQIETVHRSTNDIEQAKECAYLSCKELFTLAKSCSYTQKSGKVIEVSQVQSTTQSYRRVGKFNSTYHCYEVSAYEKDTSTSNLKDYARSIHDLLMKLNDNEQSFIDCDTLPEFIEAIKPDNSDKKPTVSEIIKRMISEVKASDHPDYVQLVNDIEKVVISQ